MTGLLEVANFSEEIAAAQLNAQRRCRLQLGPWALKFNHELMIDIALDTMIGCRLRGLVLAEVCCPVFEIVICHRIAFDYAHASACIFAAGLRCFEAGLVVVLPPSAGFAAEAE